MVGMNQKMLEERITKIIENNKTLMEKFSIQSIADLKFTLGNRYVNNITRWGLISYLSAEDGLIVKEFYLKTCNAGKDNCPACLKVKVSWECGKPDDAILDTDMVSFEADFDRINSGAVIEGRFSNGDTFKKTQVFDSEFEDQFFAGAEDAYWAEESDECFIDEDHVSVRCEYADGTIRESSGDYPDPPYEQLYLITRDFLNELYGYKK